MHIITFLQQNWVLIAFISAVCLLVFRSPKNAPLDVAAGLTREKLILGGSHISDTGCAKVETIFGLTPDDPLFNSVMAAIGKGNKVEAIKLLRKEKSLDLTAAKQIVDLLEKNRNVNVDKNQEVSFSKN